MGKWMCCWWKMLTRQYESSTCLELFSGDFGILRGYCIDNITLIVLWYGCTVVLIRKKKSRNGYAVGGRCSLVSMSPAHVLNYFLVTLAYCSGIVLITSL